jgi:hypothetical protein
MDFVPVQSSTLESVCYDPDTQMLYVNFVKGYCYKYFNVPTFIYESLIEASSAGKYFVGNIQYAFPYERC